MRISGPHPRLHLAGCGRVIVAPAAIRSGQGSGGILDSVGNNSGFLKTYLLTIKVK